MTMRFGVLFIAFAAAAAVAQDVQRVTVPLSDPSRPGTLRAELMFGDITVRGHSGAEVIVESAPSSRPQRSRPRRRAPEEVEGLKRIDLGNAAALNIEEHENVVTITSRAPARDANVLVSVPQNTGLRLKTMNGEIVVEKVRGEIEVTSHNGEVRMSALEGSVVAHSLNGDVVVSMDRLEPKPMSFSTMNGNIDVTLPPDTKANLKLRNDHGEVYTDFEMKLESVPSVESEREKGRYRVRFDRTMAGSINGGGPEISLRTVNGQIRIRQKK